jgi:ATP-binding cassette, subfamily B, bacterial
VTPRRHYSDLALLGRLLQQAKAYWPHVGALLLLELAVAPLALLAPLPLKLVVDSGMGSEPVRGVLGMLLPAVATHSRENLVVSAAVLLVVIVLLSQLQALGSSALRAYSGEKLVLGFRSQLFRHVQRLSLSYHDTRGIADSMYRIQSDAPALQYVAVDWIIPFISSVVTLVTILYVTARLDWHLALVALVVTPVLVLASHAYRGRLRRQSGQVKTLETSAQSVLQEVLGAVRVVKAFGQEEREEQRFIHRSSEGIRARLRLILAEGRLGMVVSLTTGIGTALVLVIGTRHVWAGTLTLGELLLVMGYLGQLYTPLRTIGRKVASLQSHLASAERAFALLDEVPDVVERQHARPLARASGAVRFQNVSFAYGQERAALHDISFAVPSGSRVGITGATGAGKTTLVNLLTRFYDPTSGDILLDGIDLRDYKLSDLRQQFAIVLQEPVLFSNTIAENIAYARPGAGEAEIVAAAKAASAHEFIVSMPGGYQTLVGERGVRLSGGERQRVSLARAFLKDAPILILDEPTSSIDSETESAIMDATELLMGGRTSFMITHRSSTLAYCDQLLRIESGRLVQMESSDLTDGLCQLVLGVAPGAGSPVSDA